MNISIVMPNYNGEKILPRSLPAVLEAVENYKAGKVEIIIADDPSTDNSAQVISDFFKSIENKNIVCKTVSNKDKRESGFSKNVNRGVKLATGEILILLNSDVMPHKDFLKPLLSQFETNPKLFAVGCMDESIENGKVVLRGRAEGSWQRGFLMHREGKLDRTNTLWVSGGSGAFRKSIWDKIGGLNELFNPFYWEDIDLSYRAQKCGYEVRFEKKSIVRHEHEEGPIKKFVSNYNKIKVVYRNQFTFVWINITDKNLFLSHIFWLPYHLIKAFIRRDKAFFWGFWHAVLRLPKIMEYKKNMRKIFVKMDKEILGQFS